MQITVKTEKVAANALSLGELSLMLCEKVAAKALSLGELRLMLCLWESCV